MSAMAVDVGGGATHAIDLIPMSPSLYRRAKALGKKESRPESHSRLVTFSSTLWRSCSSTPAHSLLEGKDSPGSRLG